MFQNYHRTLGTQLWGAQGTWLIRALVVGTLVGTSAALFLWLLDAATSQRQQMEYWRYGLPLWGILGSLIYQYWGTTVASGNNLILQRLAVGSNEIPWRMAPLIILTTVVSHLFGASVGREGTAVQSGAAISAAIAHSWPTQRWWAKLIGWWTKLIERPSGGPPAGETSPHSRETSLLSGETDLPAGETTHQDAKLEPAISVTTSAANRIWLSMGISSGFGAVFGTPLAGTIFAAEVAIVGTLRYEGILACLISAITGDLVCRAWGATHTVYPKFSALPWTFILWAKLAVAGISLGFVALLFIELTGLLSRWGQRRLAGAPGRGLCGGLILLALTAGLQMIMGRQILDYLGLSLPLLVKAVNGEPLAASAFVIKILFTAISLAAGFKGGEVTPLFVIGATAGYTLAGWLGLPPEMLAKVGFIAVFAAAANTPLSCLLMGIELFGGEIALPAAWVCWLAYLSSGHRSIYTAQQFSVAKAG